MFARNRFQKTIEALRESLNIQSDVCEIDQAKEVNYKDAMWVKDFKKYIFKAIDKANKATVKRTGATRGRNATMELAVAIDPTEATTRLTFTSDKGLKLQFNVLHQNLDVAKKAAQALVKELKSKKEVNSVDIDSLEAASDYATGQLVVLVNLK